MTTKDKKTQTLGDRRKNDVWQPVLIPRDEIKPKTDDNKEKK